MRKDLDVQDFKIQLVQELKPYELSLWVTNLTWVLAKFDEDPLFYRQIVFKNETHFAGMNASTNKIFAFYVQNSHKCAAWCKLRPGGIVGPYLFEDDKITVAGVRYRAMIMIFFRPKPRA